MSKGNVSEGFQGPPCPGMTEEETAACHQFTREVGTRFQDVLAKSQEGVDPRAASVAALPFTWIQAIQFLVYIKQILATQGMQDFIKNSLPKLYDILQKIEGQSGQVLVMIRALLDGLAAQSGSTQSGAMGSSAPK